MHLLVCELHKIKNIALLFVVTICAVALCYCIQPIGY